MTLIVEGRGGGKGGGGGAKEEKDSLRSTQVAEIIDVISEGECEGLVGGAKGVYLNGVPLQNDDGSFNFTGVELAWTTGTQGQAALPGINAVQTEIGVNVVVEKPNPVVRTITNPEIDRCRVTIAIPRLTLQDTKTGDIKGASFQFAIDVQSNGGGYVEVYSQEIAGKTNSRYTRSIEFALPGSAPWDIRVRRITDDATTSNVVNAFSWFSYTAIQSVKLRYPNTAYTFLRIDAEQFSNVPDRTFKWKGLRIKVPTNYNPETRAYTGTWDGTFKIAWTDNPAWVFYDMATTGRYGMGRFIDAAQVNKWALYQIGQYCDALVPDGSGGVEPRFRCNVQLRNREDAFKVMQTLAAIFRGMAYWTGSTLQTYQDAPEDASLLYTPANVIDGNFTYQDTSEKSLHSVFICYWHDMAQQGKRVPEVYAPNDLIQRYGVRELELSPIGVTSRGQAARLCRWARHSEQSEGTTVSFTVGSDGIVAAPGKIFAVADPNVAGERLAGRITATSTGQITLDAPVTLASGEVYTLTVLQPDPSSHMGYITQERTVVTPAGSNRTVLDVSPSFTAAPAVGTVWMLQSTGISSTLWRCLGVEEVPEKNQYRITGVAHNPSKYDAVELGLTLDEPVTTRIKTEATPPTDLELLETVYNDGTVNKSSLTISFVPSPDSRKHKISYRQDIGWWIDLPDTSEQSVTIRGLDPGVYEVTVRSVNGLGNVSPAVQDSITIAGGKSGVRAVRLKASSQVFRIPTAGAPSPASVTLVADVGALDESLIVWTATGGTLTGSGLSRTLTPDAMSADTCTVTATVEQGDEVYSDTLTVVRVYDGLPGDPGAPGAPGDPGAPGEDGAPAPSAVMTLDSIGLPADASGAVTSYTGASSSMVIFLGADLDTTNWTFSHVATDVTVTRTANTITVTSMAAGVAIGYVDVTATRTGFPSITKRVTVSKYRTGATGSTGNNASAYWMVLSAPVVRQNGSTFSPATVTAALYRATGTAAPVAYAGRFIVATSPDGSTFSDAYTSSTDEVSRAFTVPGGVRAIRFRAYLAGGTSSLLDEEIAQVVQDGTAGLSVTLSNESHTLPATSAGVVASYAGSGTVIRVYEGATELEYDGTGVASGSWTVVRTGSNITPGSLTDSGSFVTVGNASAMNNATDTASVTYTISGKTTAGAAFTIVRVQSFTKAKAGIRGSVQLSATTTGTAWSDSEATAAVLAAGYIEPVDRDVVTLYNSGAGWSEARVYVAGSWLTLAALFPGNILVNGTVTAEKLDVDELSSITADMGTITAGNITLDSSGFIRGGQTAYATGNGFWLGNDSTQFKISLGNHAKYLRWDGDVLQMSGDLVAAGGTFSGTLTADAINAVNTINIAENAVTVPVAAQAGNTTFDIDTGYVFVTSPSADFGGQPVVITGYVTVRMSGTSGTDTHRLQLRRNGTTIAEFWFNTGFGAPGARRTHVSPVFIDNPGAGSHAYSFVFVDGGDATTNAVFSSIVCLGVKR